MRVSGSAGNAPAALAPPLNTCWPPLTVKLPGQVNVILPPLSVIDDCPACKVIF